VTGPGGVLPAGELEVPELPGFDATRPNIARVYDFLLGGKDNYAADRAEAARLLEVFPLLPLRARQNRLFLARAVTWLAGQEGIRQFIDIGCGLPTVQNTHQVAKAVDPGCRVAYVDRDPVVICHARALLSAPGVIAVPGDLADPDAILADPALREVINLAEPAAVILAMVLHFTDAVTARGITGAITRALAPGSFVVISAGSGDEQTGGMLARHYRAGPLYNHSPAQIGAFFGGLDLIPPGLTDAMAWEPGRAAPPLTARLSGGHIVAGTGRKPAPANPAAFPPAADHKLGAAWPAASPAPRRSHTKPCSFPLPFSAAQDPPARGGPSSRGDPMTYRPVPAAPGAVPVPAIKGRLEPDAIGATRDTVIGVASSAPAATVGDTRHGPGALDDTGRGRLGHA